MVTSYDEMPSILMIFSTIAFYLGYLASIWLSPLLIIFMFKLIITMFHISIKLVRIDSLMLTIGAACFLASKAVIFYGTR